MPKPRSAASLSLVARAALVAVALPAASAWAGEWMTRPWLRPSGGATSWNNGETTVTAFAVGGNAGLDYWQRQRKVPRLVGQARVGGSYMAAGGNATGYEVRFGNFLGPQWKYGGLSFGPDVFYNQWTYAGTVLPATTGVATPLVLNGRLEVFTAHVGIEPSWYVSGNRQQTDWQEAEGFGFGHEFAYLGGVGVNVQGLHLGVHGRRSITAYGVQNSIGFSANYSPPPKSSKKKGKKKGGKRR